MTLFTRSERMILTLSGSCAIWSRWRGEKQIDEFMESLPMGLGRGTQCPWVTEAVSKKQSQEVHLIVDSAHSEVLRVETSRAQAEFGRSWLIDLIQQRRLLKQLHQNHPDAVVSCASGTSVLEAVWLAREKWPEHWRDWLQLLQEQGVVYETVSCSTQLLAQANGLLSDDLNGDKRSDVLYVLVGSQSQQHALVRGGVVLFRRIVAVDGEDSIRTALTESLNHLQSQLSVDSLAIAQLGVPHALCGELKSHAIVSDEIQAILESDVEVGADEPATDEAVVDEPVGLQDRRVARLWAQQLIQSSRRRVVVPASGPVSDMYKRRISRRQVMRLSIATAFSMLIACVTVAFAALEGYNSVRQGLVQQEVQLRLSQRIAQFEQSMQDLHPQAETAAQLLMHIDTLEQSREASTPDLLTLLGEVLTQSPAIGLDTLRWRSGGSQLDLREPLLVLHSESEAGKSSGSSEWAISSDHPPVSLVLEFSGKVDGSHSLRERQERFDAFVQRLLALETVARVEILLSPLAQAAAGSTAALSRQEPDYQLRVSLHDS